MNLDLLKVSRWMALIAIALCSIATIIAYFSVEFLDDLTMPLLVVGIFVWVLAVIWFLWGWLKNANDEGNERKGVSASSYILAFLPLCYCFLMATDEARTKIKVKIENQYKPLHSIKIYGSGTIFLKPDTLKLGGLGIGDKSEYTVKASTSPHMRGDIFFEGFLGDRKIKKKIAGPFSIHPMNINTRWKVLITESFLDSLKFK